MAKPTEAELSEQNEELLTLCEQLQARIESLTQDNAALREQLAAGESQAERLSALVEGERWVPLDKTNSIRAADIRQIEEMTKPATDTIHEGVRRWMYWPYPSLRLNDRIEVKYPVWTRMELLQLIGATEIPTLRTWEEIEWEKGSRIGEGQTKI